MSKITNMRKVKQDDKFSLAVREIQSQHPANKKCFDCEQRGPTYLNMTIGSFVCTKCSGMLRGEQICRGCQDFWTQGWTLTSIVPKG